jgi:hypothetical protein
LVVVVFFVVGILDFDLGVGILETGVLVLV